MIEESIELTDELKKHYGLGTHEKIIAPRFSNLDSIAGAYGPTGNHLDTNVIDLVKINELKVNKSIAKRKFKEDAKALVIHYFEKFMGLLFEISYYFNNL